MPNTQDWSNMSDFIVELENQGKISKYQELKLLQGIDQLILLDLLRKTITEKLNEIIENQ